MRKSLSMCVYVNTAIAVALSVYLFVAPAVIIVHDLNDPGLCGGPIPRCALRWHRALSPPYEKWARRRVQSGSATRLTTGNISGTEWPLFGSVFYLWATEALQEAARDNPAFCPVPAPRFQMLLWLLLLVESIGMGLAFGAWLALVFLLAAFILPWQSRRPVPAATLSEPLSSPR